jgi:hypothetical protein
LKDVPKIYHEFADVFSRQKADTLPPHRDCDLKINIDKGAKIPAGPICPLSEFELKLSENLLMKTSRLDLSILQILYSEHLFFLLRKKTDHSDYVLISDGLMLSLEKTSILYR